MNLEVRSDRGKAVAFLVGFLLFTVPLQGSEDLPRLNNADFRDFRKGVPSSWASDLKQVTLSSTGDGGMEMRSLARTNVQGNLFQELAGVPPRTLVRLSATVRSSRRGAAFLQLKLIRQGKEIARFSSRPSGGKEGPLSVDVDTGEADALAVCLRLDLSGEVGDSATFKDVRLAPAPPPPPLEVVPGFASAALYRNHVRSERVEDFTSAVKVREAPNGEWRDAFPLTHHPGDRQARGVLVNLREDTAYEALVETVDGGAPGRELRSFRTLSSEVPIAKTVLLEPADLTNGFQVEESGTPEGYVRYATRPGTVLRATREKPQAILLDKVECVILDGLVVEGGGYDCIRVNDCRNVRIRGCDLSGYGTPRVIPFDTGDEKGSGVYRDKGVWINNQAGISVQGSEGVLIERNFVHDPLSRANSWFYSHPAGPNATFFGRARAVTMRYNDFVGSDAHRWNDASEGWGNGEIEGGLCKDAEIYGNFLAFGNDDGIELDGGQINTRFFRNRIEGGFTGISTAPCLRGPSFVFENLVTGLRDELGGRNVAIKNNFGVRGDGKIHLFNNTVSVDANAVSGFGKGASDRDSGNVKLVSRNNVLQAAGFFTPDHLREKVLLDHDLLSPAFSPEGMFETIDAARQESNGLRRKAPFRDPERGDFRLSEALKGEAVPGFAPEGRLGTDLVLPERPLPFLASASRVNLSPRKTSDEVVLEVTSPGWKESFRIVQPAATRHFRVTPESGILEAGRPVRLKVEALPANVPDARIHSGSFLVRTTSGLSRPVTVSLDDREDEAKVRERRRSAIYGRVEKAGGTCKLVFDLPTAGRHYLFARFNSAVTAISVNGEAMQVRSGDARPGDPAWGNIGNPQGKVNAPLAFKAGRNELLLAARSEQAFEVEDCALASEPETFLYASGNFAR